MHGSETVQSAQQTLSEHDPNYCFQRSNSTEHSTPGVGGCWQGVQTQRQLSSDFTCPVLSAVDSAGGKLILYS